MFKTDFALVCFKCQLVIYGPGDATGGKVQKANTGKPKMSRVHVFSCLCSLYISRKHVSNFFGRFPPTKPFIPM